MGVRELLTKAIFDQNPDREFYLEESFPLGFLQNAYSHRTFSKLRASIAGLYVWRVSHAAGATDQARMVREADFAFRQAWALCPYSPEAVFRYVNFLVDQKRVDEAILVAGTATKLPQSKDNTQLVQLVNQLKQWRK